MSTERSLPVWLEMPSSPAVPSGANHDVIVVGAGPVGLSIALDLARRGRSVTVLTKLPYIAACSKAICFAKHTLDIFDRLGVGERVVAKGVRWHTGKVFHGPRREPVYTFDLSDVSGQRNPAFVNIQQYYVEQYLVEALRQYERAEIRWGHEVERIEQDSDGVRISARTGSSSYTLRTRYLIACDGSRSPVRKMLNLDFSGRVFEDNFLIADVRFAHDQPAERRFWFDPPWPGASSLMHRQPDGVWRLDFQLGWEIDREEAVKPENVDPFVRGMLGPDVEYEYEWISVYTFQCRRMSRFVHDRVIFAGDSAHLVSPFGARGCNNGIADADNLGWKVDKVLRGQALPEFLKSYDYEARIVADENILNSTRSTEFITPKNDASRAYRDAILALARDCEFARPLVNSGRLSTAISFPGSPCLTRDDSPWLRSGVAPGSPALDARNGDEWLLSSVGGDFVLFVEDENIDCGSAIRVVPLRSEEARERYRLGRNGATLVRPDGYVAARWKEVSAAKVSDAINRAISMPCVS